MWENREQKAIPRPLYYTDTNVIVVTNASAKKEDQKEAVVAPRRTFASTTLAQLFSFTLFIASMVICVNNALDASYKIKYLVNFKDVLVSSDRILRVGSSLIVLFLSMSSPFEEDETFVVSIEGTHNSFSRVVYFGALCYTSMSEIVEDPDVLFTQFRTVLYAIISTTSELSDDLFDVDSYNDTATSEILDQTIDITRTSTFGEDFVWAMAFSKFICLVGAVCYAILIILSDLPDLRRSTITQFRTTVWGRLWQLCVLVANGYGSYAVLCLQDSDFVRESHRRVQQLISISETALEDGIYAGQNFTTLYAQGSLAESTLIGVFMTSDSSAAQAFGTLLMLGVCAYITVCYQHYNYALPLLLVISSQQLVLVEESTASDDFYSIFLITTLVLCTSTAAFLVTQIRIISILHIIPNILYKAGLVLCIMSFPFLILGWSHSWIQTSFQPIDLTSKVITRLQAVDDQFDHVYDVLVAKLQKLNPCMRSFATDMDIEVNTSSTFTEQYNAAAEQVEDALIEQRYENAQSGAIFDLTQCIDSVSPYAYTWQSIPKIRFLLRTACRRMMSREEDMRQEILENIADEIAQNIASGTEVSTISLDENEYYVDSFCSEMKCTIFTNMLLTTFILAQVPYIGAAFVWVNQMLKIGWKFFRLGLRLIRKLPKFYAKRKQIKRLKKLLQLLVMSRTEKSIGPSKVMLWVFFPVLLSLGIALTLIMIRRQQQVGWSGPGAMFSARFILGMKIAVGLSLPVMVAELVVYVVMVYYPVVLQDLGDAMPSWLVNVTVEVDIGLEAMKTAYLISFIGNLLVILGALSYIEVEVVSLLLKLPGILYRIGKRIMHTLVGKTHRVFWYTVDKAEDAVVRIAHDQTHLESHRKRRDERRASNKKKNTKAKAKTKAKSKSKSNNKGNDRSGSSSDDERESLSSDSEETSTLLSRHHSKSTPLTVVTQARVKPVAEQGAEREGQGRHQEDVVESHKDVAQALLKVRAERERNGHVVDAEATVSTKEPLYRLFGERAWRSITGFLYRFPLLHAFLNLIGVVAFRVAPESEALLIALLDWKVQYLQPLLFSIIPIPIIIYITYDATYADITYTVKDDIVKLYGDLSGSQISFAAIDDITEDLGSVHCGWIGKVSVVLMQSFIKLLNEIVKPFQTKFNLFLSSLTSFQGQLESLVETYEIDVTEVLPHTTVNALIYIVPVACTTILLIIWVISLVATQLYVLRPLRRFVGAEKVSLDSLMGIVAGAILMVSISMVVVHIIVGSMLQNFQDANIPYFNFNVSLGWKYYLIIAAHCANAMSAIAHYVNILVPPINY